MKRHTLWLTLLAVIAIAAIPGNISAVEGTKSLLDEHDYGQDGKAGYRPQVPMRDYPEYISSPMPAPAQAYLSPDSLRAVLRAGESVIEEKLLHLPEAAGPEQGDILLCIDVSGSMGDELERVKLNAVAIMESVRVLIPDTYFGVVSHMDYPELYEYCGYAAVYGDPVDGDYPYGRNQSLTGDLNLVHNAINSLSLGDGADAPESYSRVLYEAVADAGLAWREDSKKVVVQFGDAIPHDCNVRACVGGTGSTGGDPGRDGIMGNTDDLSILKVVGAMAVNDITLISLYSGLSSSSLSLWNCLAKKTGGEAFEINPDGTVPGDEDFAAYIADLIEGRFREIDMLTLEVCEPAFAEWLVGLSPAYYENITLDRPYDLPFEIEIQVPEGTAAGEYCFDICAVGDGAVYAVQHVCIRVLPGGCIDLDLGEEMNAEPYSTVEIPVYVSEMDDWGVNAVSMEVCWCEEPGGFMTFEYCQPGEVLTGSGWTDYDCTPGPGNCVTLSATGANALTGSGPLLYLYFLITGAGAPCECCDVWFGRRALSDGQFEMPLCPVGDGKVCMASCDIQGNVYNWYCVMEGDPIRTHPLEGAEILLTWCETPMGARLTDSVGRYLFECLPLIYECPYCVTPRHDPVPGNIRAYDASLVLQYVVMKDDLEDCPIMTGGGTVYPQQVAAEVSCESGISSYDASLILQYVVEKISEFPCGIWEFVPEEKCVWNCHARADFVGILLGDVSGPLPGPGVVLDPPVPVLLGVPYHYDEYVEMAVKVKNSSDVFAAEFEVLFDSDALTVDDVYTVGLAEDFAVEYNVPSAGRLLIGIAGDTPFGGSGKVVMIVFKKNYMTLPVVAPIVSLNDALFNEGVPVADVIEKDYPAEIHRITALGPVTPNPFSVETTIRFSLPERAHVQLNIYDVTGQLVKSLMDSEAPAGVSGVDWDGTDSRGRSVARGVYFVRMQAGEFRASEKLVLLK